MPSILVVASSSFVGTLLGRQHCNREYCDCDRDGEKSEVEGVLPKRLTKTHKCNETESIK